MALPAAPSRVRVPLARHGLAEVPVRRVAIGDGEVWRVGPLADAAGEPVWRCLRVWSAAEVDLDAIAAQMTWLEALAADGLPVPAPLRDRDGQLLLHGLTEAQPTVAVVLHWVPGRMLFAGLRPVHLRRIGHLMARLQGHAAHRAGAEGFASRRVNGIPLDDWAAGRLPVSAWFTPRWQSRVRGACADLSRRVDAWPRDPQHWGYLHGDLHPWNLVHHRGEVGVIDFGDCGWGWWAQEFASVLQWLQRSPEGWHDHRGAYPALRDALFDGYTSLRPLPPGAVDWLDDLLLLRRLGTLRWMIEDWPRPAHRPWGPAFLRALQRTLGA